MPKIFLVIFLLINIVFNGVVYANSSEDKQEKNPTLLISSNQEDKVKITLSSLNQNISFLSPDYKNITVDKPFIEKGKFLEWLKNKHQQGEYLDIPEELIKSLTEEELNNLITTELAIKIMSLLNEDLVVMNEAMDKDVTNNTTENMLNFEPVSITEYGDIYNLPKETELSIMDSIKQYSEEKKEALAILALGGTLGLLLLKQGKTLLKYESQSYREYRHNRMNDLKEEFKKDCQEKELINIKKGKIDKIVATDKEFWKFYKKNNSFTNNDNLKNLAEEALYTGTTQQQMKNFVKENNKAWNNIEKNSEVMCKDFDKQISQKYNQDIRTDRKKILKVCEKSKIHEAPSIKENIDNFATLAEETQK